jgi:hypothetical protein
MPGPVIRHTVFRRREGNLSDQSRPPRLMTCGTGVILGISLSAVVSCVLVFMPSAITFIMGSLLYIPSELGLVNPIRPEERIPIHIPGERDLELARDGAYDIFSTYILPPVYHITLTRKATGESIPVYPAVLPEGESDPTAPVYEFEVAQAGVYRISVQYPEGEREFENYLTIVPDVPNQELLAILFAAIQLALLGFLIWVVVQQVRRVRARKSQSARHGKWRQWQPGTEDEGSRPG